MYLRAVRFTDVNPDRVEQLLARVNSEGPPPGVPIKRMAMMYDEGQRTAVVLQYFDTAEDLETGAQAFAAMDPTETPGTRVSVDSGEVKIDL